MPRWKRTPAPAINTVIHFYGICTQISLNGLLAIEIEGITLNVGPPQLPLNISHPPDDSGSPQKKCHFQTFASLHQPTSASSPSQQFFSPMWVFQYLCSSMMTFSTIIRPPLPPFVQGSSTSVRAITAAVLLIDFTVLLLPHVCVRRPRGT